MTHRGGLAPAGSMPPEMSASVMTPIVFCASLVPCARETNEAEAIWPRLNIRSDRTGLVRAVTL